MCVGGGGGAGGGESFESEVGLYDNGTFEGLNQFGEKATKWRDEHIAKLTSGNN